LIPLARARILRAVMKSVSVFEHEVISEPLSDGEKNTLERLRDSSGKKLFDVGWRETRATSFVGVVQLPQTTLQVLPKMYRRILDGRDGPPGRPSPTDAARPAVAPYLPDAKEREATANLLFLLSYTRKLDVTEPEISRLTDQRAPFSEILFWVFAHRLWDAVQREVLRGYVTIEDRLDVLKGRWLVAAQAARPDGWRRDRFDVAYDEFTEDNLPNRLFKATVHRLSRWSQWTDTRRHLTQLRAVFADVADVAPQPHDFDEAGHWMERYRRRIGERHLYRPLLKLAQMFWTGTGPQPSPGRTETFAFLFDMNQLFEEFIAEFIRRELREVWQSRGWTFHAPTSTQ
jgi:5-methylcytosine-specific restriction enzyme subunit McrC